MQRPFLVSRGRFNPVRNWFYFVQNTSKPVLTSPLLDRSYRSGYVLISSLVIAITSWSDGYKNPARSFQSSFAFATSSFVDHCILVSILLSSCKSALNPPPPPPVVCSTDRSKAVVPVLVLLFVVCLSVCHFVLVFQSF